MAVRTNYELLDILDPTKDYSISATDLDNNTVSVISSANTLQYLSHKYPTRQYSTLRGGDPATAAEAATDFNNDFKLWLANRQHNIDKLYQSMFDYDYSPIENVDRFENEVIDATDATTFGHKNTAGGSDSVTYGKKNTESGTTGYSRSETVDTDSTTTVTDDGEDTTTYAGTETDTTQRAGFNSPNSYTPDTQTTHGRSGRNDTTEYGKEETTVIDGTDETSITDTTTHGKVDTLSGTDSTTYGRTDTESGTNSTDHDSERTLRVHGNIGVTSNVELLRQEEEYRLQSLAELLIDNFINDYTFYS